MRAARSRGLGYEAATLEAYKVSIWISMFLLGLGGEIMDAVGIRAEQPVVAHVPVGGIAEVVGMVEDRQADLRPEPRRRQRGFASRVAGTNDQNVEFHRRLLLTDTEFREYAVEYVPVHVPSQDRAQRPTGLL